MNSVWFRQELAGTLEVGRDKNSGVEIGEGWLARRQSWQAHRDWVLDTEVLNLQGESRAENHMIGKHLTELVLK